MMSSARKSFLDSFRLKWQFRNESSMNIHLLSDEPPEIELSDYRRLPGSDIENPSELLGGEGLKAEPIADLDLFFESLYNYYCEKGLLCIVTKWIVELLTIIFVLGFIWFFLLVVDWHALRSAKCGIEAVESGQKPCDLAKEVINHHPLVPFTFTKGVIVGCMIILTIYGLFNFLKFFVQFKNTLKIRHFYYYSLHVTDREMRTSSWPTILEKVVQVQKEQQLCVVKDLSAHDIIMRIMRKENYLIGMLNKGVLALPISWWVPGAGPPINLKASGNKNHLILPKTLEWILNWCIFQSMFDSKFCIRSDFITNPSLLRKRLVVVGIVMFVISPCLVIFMLVYLFLWHAEQFYNHPRTASSRRWSNLSKWIYREFNEVGHFFRHRLNSSVVHASNYLNQFPSPLISTIAKFISFVSGGFAAILIIIAFLDESLLEGQIFRRNLFWYAAIFGTVTAIARAMVTDELHILDPEGAMAFVVQHTHYMPKRWRGRENNDRVRAEFETLFQYTGMMLLEEMASIFITPFLLVFVVPKRVDDILQFISDFTVDVEGVGHVCSLSLFDFERHGNSKYASSFNAPKDLRSSQGKMEKSFLSFQSAYPTWEPNLHGQQLLTKLRNFREQQLRDEMKQDSSPIWRRQINQNLQVRGELIYRFPFRKPENIGGFPISTYNLTPDLRTLDCYYLAQPLHSLDTETAFEPSRGPWRPYAQPPYREEVEIEERNRQQSHMEASTSSPFFHENSFHQYATEHYHPKDWWNRPPVGSAGPQASFLEPPSVFNHHTFRQYTDDLSERSVDEEGIRDGNDDGRSKRNLRSLWRTTYMDDDDGDGGFGLHFADEPKIERSPSLVSNVYGNHLANLPVRIIPSSSDPVE
ncbi:autophagy-related protein 9 [Dendrobium catenatum]|nr:autophagy-related protein 9 [Dendrobium catenatum]XP_028552590.1 autophagy-related protein 9 [Dendrobium catenatum]XP_028552591.1 autophagy-related protein 9 [Dendrobium catenatum]